MREAVELAMLVSLPMLLAGLVAGVLVSIFQTVTSIQTTSSRFFTRSRRLRHVRAHVPWILRLVTGFSRQLVQRLPELVR